MNSMIFIVMGIWLMLCGSVPALPHRFVFFRIGMCTLLFGLTLFALEVSKIT